MILDVDGVLTDTGSLSDAVRRGLAADAGLASVWPTLLVGPGGVSLFG